MLRLRRGLPVYKFIKSENRLSKVKDLCSKIVLDFVRIKK